MGQLNALPLKCIGVLIFIFIFTIFINTLSEATAATGSDVVWTQTYGGSQNDGANCVSNTSDGGYILTGYTGSYSNGISRVWLLKTDNKGDEQWNKTYGIGNGDVGYSVKQTTDGGYAIAGYTTSPETNYTKIYLTKTDSTGTLLWNKTFGGDRNNVGYYLAQTNDGGFIITGFTYSYGNGSMDAYLVKTDSMGNLQWNRTYGGSAMDCSHFVIQTADGGYAITGYTKSYGNKGGDAFGEGAEDLWLLKTDKNGNELWNRTYGGIEYDDGFSVLQNQNGGYTIAGATQSFSSNNTVQPYLLKTDSVGNLLWNKTYLGEVDSSIFSMDRSSDGGYLLAGTIFTKNNSADLVVIRTDAEGNKLWANAYGGMEDDYGYSVSPSSDGGFVIAGDTMSRGYGGQDMILMKIADNASTNITVTVSPTMGGSGSGSICSSLLILPLVIGCPILFGLVTKRKKE